MAQLGNRASPVHTCIEVDVGQKAPEAEKKPASEPAGSSFYKPSTFVEARKVLVLLKFGARKVLVSLLSLQLKSAWLKMRSYPPTALYCWQESISITIAPPCFCSYGDRWRNLRRLMTTDFRSSSRIAMFSSVRKEEVWLLLKDLFQDTKQGWAKVELSSLFIELTLNIVLRMIAGKRYHGKNAGQEAKRFQAIMREIDLTRGSSNLNNCSPVLQWVDYNGVERKMRRLMEKLDKFLQDLVEEQRRTRSGPTLGSNNQKSTTLIDIMLSLKETDPDFYTDETIKGVVVTAITAGTQTSAASLDWAMTLLLNNPETLSKASAEIENVVGVDHLLDEKDLPKLGYLHNIINETLRICPPTPLLLPHESSKGTTVAGFYVPPGTTLLVNAWSIHRDPELWKEPTKFRPERFEGGESVRKTMLAFGAGRRSFPGYVLGKQVMASILGALFQSFEWQRVSEGEEISMEEAVGLSMPKAEPLEVLCRPRQSMINLLSVNF